MEILGINIMYWIAIFSGCGLLAGMLVIWSSESEEDYEEFNWMNMESYDNQLKEITKIDYPSKLDEHTSNMFEPLTQQEIDNYNEKERIITNRINEVINPSKRIRDKNGKFIKQSTVLSTDYYAAKHPENSIQNDSI